jgi:two-component system cell cycle response regulator CpdR
MDQWDDAIRIAKQLEQLIDAIASTALDWQRRPLRLTRGLAAALVHELDERRNDERSSASRRAARRQGGTIAAQYECSVSRILVAEDDAEMRRLIVEALRKDGHDVIEASDGGQLQVAIADESFRDPALSQLGGVVSDVRMPVCGGLDVLERLVLRQQHVPFILITAFGDDETRRRAKRLGALLLDKPLSLDVLREAMADLIAGRGGNAAVDRTIA